MYDEKIKLKKINKAISKLKKMANKYAASCDYNSALACISACASVEYTINQVYTDEYLEDMLLSISKKKVNSPDAFKADEKTVLFYDGFGLDLRGHAVTFTRAIACGGFKLVYVIPENTKSRMPHVIREISSYDVEVIELVGNTYLDKVTALNNIFQIYKPKIAFFYTTPSDVVGTVVFDAYKNKVTRYQIDLTDHAFWLGVKAVDFIMEGRDMGASLAVYQRGFKKEQLKNLHTVTYINRDKCDKPLPFDIEKEKYVFSGGSLYKTLGDKDLLFYKTIRHILNKFDNIKYLYAGSGNHTQMAELAKEYPGRVFLIDERPDFFRLIENCEFYLNTYPMFGGMMMRFAAMAYRLPLTLKHEDDAEGQLLNQKEIGIEFDKYDDFLKEIDKVLMDVDYRRQKEKLLRNSVLREDVFNRNIKSLIEHNSTEFPLNRIPVLDTSKFREEYIQRFKYPDDLANAVIRKDTINLITAFPDLFLYKCINKIKKVLLK